MRACFEFLILEHVFCGVSRGRHSQRRGMATHLSNCLSLNVRNMNEDGILLYKFTWQPERRAVNHFGGWSAQKFFYGGSNAE